MTNLIGPLVTERGDEPAVVDDRRTTSWRELDDRVARLVHALRDRGLQPGDRILSFLGNQAEVVELSVACAHGGWIIVPLNWHSVAREMAYVVDDAAVAAVVVDHRWLDVASEGLGLASTPVAITILAGDVPAEPGWEPYESVVASGRGGEIADAVRGGPMFYTSGTTGNPKGVRSALTTVGGPPEMFALMAHSLGPTIDVPPGERRVQLVCGPTYHSAQWVFAHFSLYCGATVVMQHKFDAADLLALVERHRVTNVHLVPTQMRRLLDLPDDVRLARDVSSLRTVVHGAAPCPPSVKRAMIEWVGPIVTEYYGGTEGGFISTISAAEWLARPTSVGRPTPIMEIEIVGPDGEALPPGETGEIWFRNVMGSDFEYHKAPAKTVAAHRRGGFGTLGDVGHVDAEGYLHLSDRKIDLIVSGGVNIYPAEVEGVLAAHPAVADVAVFGVPHEDMGEAVHAALALRPGHAWSPGLQDDIDAWCRRDLAGFKRPRSYEVHSELPRSEAGKLTKRALRDPWWADRERAI